MLNFLHFSTVNVKILFVAGNNGKDVLKLVNGYFRAGCLNVIVGPSGYLN